MEDISDCVLVMERDTTLKEAVQSENITHVLHLLQNGDYNLNQQDFNGRTVLFWSVNRGNVDLTKCFIQNGADVRIVDNYGNTALHFCGDIEILNILVSYGADISARNKGGISPREMAERRGVSQSVVQEYLDLEQHRCKKYNVAVSSPTVLQEFCQEIGWRNLTLLLVGILFVSFYVAYTITGMSRHLEYRYPIILDGQNVKL